MRARLGSTFSSLQVRNYRLFAIGQLISLIFGWVQITAQDWLVLQLSHNSGTALGTVTALQFAPVLLFSLYAGKLADRFDKRVLLLVVNAAWLVLASIMGVLVVSGVITMWQVFIFAAAWGSVSSIETPVRQSFVSELVGSRLLPNALSLSAAQFNTARVVGPALGGVVIALLGTGPSFIVNAVSYVGPLVALSMMSVGELRRTRPAGAPVSAQDARVIDGLRYVARRGDLILPMLLILVIGMLGFNFQLTLSLLAKTVFRSNAATFGLLNTALALGALAGALFGAARRARPTVWLVTGAAVAFGFFETVAALGPSYLIVALLLVPTGFSMIFFSQAANQRVQLGVDAGMRGRVMALYFMVFNGTAVFGSPLIGWLAQTFGPRSSLWVGGLMSLVAGVAALVVRLRMAGGRLRLRVRPSPRLYVMVGPAAELDEPVATRVEPVRVGADIRCTRGAAPAQLCEPITAQIEPVTTRFEPVTAQFEAVAARQAA